MLVPQWSFQEMFYTENWPEQSAAPIAAFIALEIWREHWWEVYAVAWYSQIPFWVCTVREMLKAVHVIEEDGMADCLVSVLYMCMCVEEQVYQASDSTQNACRET